MARWFPGPRWKTRSCKEVTRLFSESLDRKLSFREGIAVRFHFLICKWCTRYAKQLRLIRDILCSHFEKVGADIPDTLSSEAKERIRHALHRSRA